MERYRKHYLSISTTVRLSSMNPIHNLYFTLRVGTYWTFGTHSWNRLVGMQTAPQSLFSLSIYRRQKNTSSCITVRMSDHLVHLRHGEKWAKFCVSFMLSILIWSWCTTNNSYKIRSICPTSCVQCSRRAHILRVVSISSNRSQFTVIASVAFIYRDAVSFWLICIVIQSYPSS